MTEVEQFQFHDQKVRVIDLDGESWWIARDVCDVLAIKDVSMATRSLDDDERGTAGGRDAVDKRSELGRDRAARRAVR